MLSYHCSNTCRHCLYRCSPRQPNEWMTPEKMREVFTALANEPGIESIHIAGGEATMRMDLLEESIRLAVDMGLRICYVETNAFWCKNPNTTVRQLERLRAAGLDALLVSVSMYHNEFIPFECTRNCIEAASEVFGEHNVLVYLPHLYQMLSQLPHQETHTLEEFRECFGIAEDSQELLQLFPLIPGGRVGEALGECYEHAPAECFMHESCYADLTNTSHFHIDNHGNLITGYCAGLSVATIENLHPVVTESDYPLFMRLCQAGPYGLYEIARDQYGYQQNPRGYISKCDFCFQLRRFLHDKDQFPELRPTSFYAD
jgi:MoaA/NifB/PqqE/SkfB family radical SAM enzyme